MLSQILDSDPMIHVVATAADPYQARDMIIRYEPDLHWLLSLSAYIFVNPGGICCTITVPGISTLNLLTTAASYTYSYD